MARPKAFHVGDALDRAIHQFGKHGFTATSLDDLTAAMGISRSSLYDTFGSKHDLFLAAIAHHNETVLPQQFTALKTPEIGLKPAIIRIFNAIADDARTDAANSAWFLAKTAGEVAPEDERATQIIAAGFKTVEQAFQDAIAAAQQNGEITPWRNPRALAHYFTAALSGFAVIARTRPGPGTLEDITAVVLTALD